MKNIKYNLASDSWDGEEISAINDVIKSNRYTMGPKVKKYIEEREAAAATKIQAMARGNLVRKLIKL